MGPQLKKSTLERSSTLSSLQYKDSNYFSIQQLFNSNFMANGCINRQAEIGWCKCEICRVEGVGNMIALFLEPSVVAAIVATAI